MSNPTKSIENALIHDCLQELRCKSHIELQQIFKNAEIDFGDFGNCCIYYEQDNFHYIDVSNSPITFHNLKNVYKQDFILSLLSRTPDGQAVMPFLDVKLDWTPLNYFLSEVYELEIKKNISPQKATEEIKKIYPINTLDHLLYREFTEVLQTGKTFDEALEIIDKIYLENLKK